MNSFLSVSSSALIEELRSLRDIHVHVALAFDADGTLWSGDVAYDCVLGAAKRQALLPEARHALVECIEKNGLDINTKQKNANELFMCLWEAYQDERVSGHEMCEVNAYAFAGYHASALSSLVLDILEEEKLSDRLQKESIDLITWAKSQNIPVYVVSASPDFVVCPAARVLDIHLSHIVATQACMKDGIVQPDVHRPIPHGEGKVFRLRERWGDHFVKKGKEPPLLLAAFGDNTFDADLLHEAKKALLVRPKPGLLSVMQKSSSARILVP